MRQERGGGGRRQDGSKGRVRAQGLRGPDDPSLVADRRVQPRDGGGFSMSSRRRCTCLFAKWISRCRGPCHSAGAGGPSAASMRLGTCRPKSYTRGTITCGMSHNRGPPVCSGHLTPTLQHRATGPTPFLVGQRVHCSKFGAARVVAAPSLTCRLPSDSSVHSHGTRVPLYGLAGGVCMKGPPPSIAGAQCGGR